MTFAHAALASTDPRVFADALVDELRAVALTCERQGPWLTPSDVPLVALDQPTLDALAARGIEDVLPLTPLQQGLLFHAALGPDEETYVNQLCLRLADVDPRQMESAWRVLMQRHAVLRSAPLEHDGIQGVWRDLPLPWSTHGIGAHEGPADTARIMASRRKLVVTQPPLWHVDLVREGDRDALMVLTVHHIILDGWSVALLLAEAQALYRDEPAPAPPPPFADFLRWLADQDIERARQYWRERLAGFAPTLLASAKPDGRKDVRQLSRSIDVAALNAARSLGLTQSTLLQATWALVLSEHTGRHRVVFGNTVAGRPADLPGSDRMLGLMINTLPVPVDVPTSPGTEWLAALQQAGAEAREYGHLALFEIQQIAGHARTGLFDTLMVFENYPFEGALADLITDIREATHYPLTLAILPGDDPKVLFSYDAAALRPDAIERLAESFERTLAGLVGGSVVLSRPRVEGAEPAPEPVRSSIEHEPPSSDAERILADLWRRLLQVDRVGRSDNFFYLGGHSLIALRIVGALSREHRLHLPLQALFEHPVLADCARHLVRRDDDVPALVPVPRHGPMPAAAAQRRLWFVHQFDPLDAAYHLPLGLELAGTVDVPALATALNVVVARHEILRTRFSAPDGTLRQCILDAAPVPVAFHDLRRHPDAAAAEAALFRDWLRQPFDLARDPLLRVGVVRREDRRYRVLLVQHHIITDGRSTALLLGAWRDAYRNVLDERPPQLEPRLHYADYAAWHRRWLESPAAGRQLDHWRAALGCDAEPIALPADFPRGGRRSDGHRLHFRLSPSTAAAARKFAAERGTTLSTTLLAAWVLLLHRWSGSENVRVGVPVAGRTRPETESMLGCFVNMVTISAAPDPRRGFDALLQQVSARSAEALDNQEIPFEAVVSALAAGRSLDHHPLFQVVFNYQQETDAPIDGWPDASVTAFDPGGAGAQFDLTLDIRADAEGEHAGFVGYDRSLFRDETAERLLARYQRLLDAVLRDPDRPVAALSLLEASERRHLHRWNDTAVDWGPFLPVPARQSEQARTTPDAVALSQGGVTLTYAVLERRVNQLAHRLRREGVGPEVRVAVCLARSVDLVVALLAVVRAGGAYLPLDPDHPHARACAILDEAKPLLVICETKVAGYRCLSPRDLDGGSEPDTPPPVAWHPDQAMYVIYTSGSTGRPKGVVNTHAALENRLLWMQRQYPIAPGDCVLQKTPFGFDVSVWEFFWPPMTGARLAIAAPDAHRDPRALRAVIDDEKVTTVHFVPSMLQAALPELAGCRPLRRIICSGEALSASLQRDTLAALPGAELHNLYGPTEAAIDVSHWPCRDDGRRSVPIGVPISNVRLHVLDACLNPVPPGVPGELCLAGIGLARGYLGRPDLTADRFLPDPFGPPGARMYRTGDQVRRGDDGVLDYLGRLDHQVKIRGLRIEPGEVETLLRQQTSVADALVLARNEALVAYIVPAGDPAAGWTDALKTALAAQLPAYMVPSRFVPLAAFPLSANGKLDRLALPEGEAPRRSDRAPETVVQRQVAEVWREVLGCGAIGLDDNFFDLGGHSLAVARTAALLRARHGWDVPLRALFDRPTLEGFAAGLDVGPGAGDDFEVMAELLSELEHG